MDAIDKFLAGKTEGDSTLAANTEGRGYCKRKTKDALTELTGGQAPTAQDTSKKAQFLREHPFFSFVSPDQRGSGDGYVELKNKERVTRLLERDEVKKILPPDFEFVWSAKAEQFRDGSKMFRLTAVKATPELTGGVITNARASIDPEDSRPVVNMEMNGEGSRDWAGLPEPISVSGLPSLWTIPASPRPWCRQKFPEAAPALREWTHPMKRACWKSF